MRLINIALICTLLAGLNQCKPPKSHKRGMGEGIMDYTRQGIPHRILFYDHPDGKVLHTLSFHDTATEDYFLKTSWFQPRRSNTTDEYGNLSELNFTCLANHQPWYEIVANENTGEKYWISDTSEWVYMEWPEFIASVALIHPLDDSAPIYEKPGLNSPKVTFLPVIKSRSVLEVQNEWMKVAYFSGDTVSTVSFSGERIPLGWIRWRCGDSLLIDYDELP